MIPIKIVGLFTVEISLTVKVSNYIQGTTEMPPTF